MTRIEYLWLFLEPNAISTRAKEKCLPAGIQIETRPNAGKNRRRIRTQQMHIG